MPQFCKLLAADLYHRGFQYKDGLNVDHVPFNPTGECQPGGLYYTTIEHLAEWYNTGWPLIADVTLPDDAQVYAEACGTKWKADKIVLSNIRLLSKFLATLDEATQQKLVLRNLLLLGHVSWQTDKLCLKAVQLDGCAVCLVQVQTPEICMAAVQQNGTALEYVGDQTDELCLAAVQENGQALMYVRNQTDAICLAAVQRNGYALVHVKNQTDEICMAAVRGAGLALEHVYKQTDTICLQAVTQDGLALQYVKNQTPEICLVAVAQNLAAKFFINITL